MGYRIGIDVDGVLADFVNGFCDLAARKLGKAICRIPNRWEWADDDLTKEEQFQLWAHITTHPGWWGTLEALDKSYVTHKTLCSWYASRYDLYAITTRPGQGAQAVTAGWLMGEFDVLIPTIITRNALDKAKVACALRLTHFVDDNADNCRAVLRELPECKTRLFDASHNQGAVDLNDHRITSLGELL
jgi:5'(3')-deoxyribonucleotidase